MSTKLIVRHTHEAGWIGDICADFAINLDEPLHCDLLDLICGQRILEPVSQENDQGKALSQFVRTLRWSWRLGLKDIFCECLPA